MTGRPKKMVSWTNWEYLYNHETKLSIIHFLYSSIDVTKDDDTADPNATTKKTKKVTFVPYNRADLLNKIESLKLADDDYEDDDDFSFCDSDLDSDFDDLGSEDADD